MDDSGFVASIAKDEKASLKPSDASLKPASELKSQIKLVERFQASVVACRRSCQWILTIQKLVAGWMVFGRTTLQLCASVAGLCRPQILGYWNHNIDRLSKVPRLAAPQLRNTYQVSAEVLGRDIQQDDNKTALKQALSEVWADAVKGLSFQAASIIRLAAGTKLHG